MWMHEALTNYFCCSQPFLHFMFRNIFVCLFFKVEILKLIKISNVNVLLKEQHFLSSTPDIYSEMIYSDINVLKSNEIVYG